jgi:hypothetical protein
MTVIIFRPDTYQNLTGIGYNKKTWFIGVSIEKSGVVTGGYLVLKTLFKQIISVKVF